MLAARQARAFAAPQPAARRRPLLVRASAAATAPSSIRVPLSADLEGTELPLNTYAIGKAGKGPFTGKVLSIRRLGGRDAERDVSEIVIDTGGVLFHEGQSFGVQPPGTKVNSRGQEVPQHVRLYSIASSRYGDRGDGRTCTLCVVRVIYPDPKTGEQVRGVCSNYLCNLKAGDELVMTGPSGTALLLPQDPWSKRIVCVSTGTGIAPFRSFWRRCFYDGVAGQPADPYADKGGMFWLISGFANRDSRLFYEELEAARAANPGHLRLDIALSLEQQNAQGGPEYVQDRMHEHAQEILDLMASDDAIFFFCGLKRMYTSVLDMLEVMGREHRGMDVPALIKELKKTHRWHVETA